MAATAKRVTKTAIVIKMLGRPKGTGIGEIADTTNWKPHTVRAFFSGLKKKGFELAREEGADKRTTYRIISTPAQADASSDTDISVMFSQSERRA